MTTRFFSFALLIAGSAASLAAKNTTPVRVCWGHPDSRCYSVDAAKVSESIKGTAIDSRALDPKAEASLRQSIDDFKTWATSKKAVLPYSKLDVCKDVLSIRTNEVPTYVCLNSVSKKEMKPKETALLDALRGSAREKKR